MSDLVSTPVHPVQFAEQMKLFMTGTELKSAITESPDRFGQQSMESMWGNKLRASKRGTGHGGGTYEALAEQGWQGRGPGLVHRDDDLYVKDAHHRIAAAADIERRSSERSIWIPTTNRS